MCNQAAPNGSVFILHTCAHNPTGVDPTLEQWEAILDVIQAKAHLPFFDTAYQVRRTKAILFYYYYYYYFYVIIVALRLRVV